MIHESTNIKFINAKQSIEVYAYKNIKRKLYKTNAAIWFNTTCRDKQLQQLHVQQPHMYEKPEAASAVLGS
jgi:hypothetical protein